MKKIIALGLFSIFGIQFSMAQDLYMPRNVKQAYERGTRSKDGLPGKNYWQNHGKYDMEIMVNADTKTVSGKENILYSNNSPDTLKNLIIRFVNNLHKPTAPRKGLVSEDFLSAGLTISSFIVDGEKYPVDAKNWGTVGTVKLNKPMAPKAKISVDIEWSYPLSKESGREGQIDPNSFFVAYSYPRISVYDDYYGWDRLPHIDGSEFYNDFNDYKFSVKAPKNYVVHATGDFLNPDEVLQPEISDRLKKSYKSDQVIHVATAEEMKAGKVTLQNDYNTWKFAFDQIVDVTFALSNHYAWDAASVVVDKKTNRRVSAQAAYNPITGKDFKKSVEYNRYALDWFSNNWPGIAYPYPKSVAFQGFADMEYPMMTNDSNFDNPKFAQLVQDHEVAHTYFPFYMGTNETRYAFMDEGWATAFEYLIGISQHGKESADQFYKTFRVNNYIKDPSAEQDQPIISMSTQVSGAGYGNNAYGKSSLAYLALKDMLGDKEFKKALHFYMDNWNGKHPIPWDFFNSFNTATQQNLNWFFQNWFFINNYMDLKLSFDNDNKSETPILVENVGGFAIPFDLVITYSDNTIDRVHYTPEVWKNNEKAVSLNLKNSKKTIKKLELDGNIFMDATPNDNIIVL